MSRRAIVLTALATLALIAIVAVPLLTADARVVTPDEAAQSFERQSARVRFDISFTSGAVSVSLLGQGVLAGDGSAGRFSGTVTVADEEPVTGELLLAGRDAWVSSSTLKLRKGKRWLHASDRLDEQAISPADLIRFLVDAEDVKDRGREVPDGESGRQYEGKVDMGELSEQMGDELGAQLEQELDGEDVELPVRIWLTPKGLPELVSMDVNDPSGLLELEFAMSDYGVRVDARPPPAREVVEPADLGAPS